MIDINTVYLNKNNKNLIQMLKIIYNRQINKINNSICYCEKHHIIPGAYYKYNNLVLDNSTNNCIFNS